MFRATFLQHEVNRVGKINTESLAKPVIMRGSDGKFVRILPQVLLFMICTLDRCCDAIDNKISICSSYIAAHKY